MSQFTSIHLLLRYPRSGVTVKLVYIDTRFYIALNELTKMARLLPK
jgi:hypothetical protein